MINLLKTISRKNKVRPMLRALVASIAGVVLYIIYTDRIFYMLLNISINLSMIAIFCSIITSWIILSVYRQEWLAKYKTTIKSIEARIIFMLFFSVFIFILSLEFLIFFDFISASPMFSLICFYLLALSFLILIFWAIDFAHTYVTLHALLKK